MLFGEEVPLRGPKVIEAFTGSFGSFRNIEMIKEEGFTVVVKRLFKNRLLMYNVVSATFYILGSTGYIAYIAKYMEVQFHRTSANATILTGPVTLFAMILGFLSSGFLISKKKPAAKYLLFWNVVVDILFMGGQFANLYLNCPDEQMPMVLGR